MPKCKMRLRPMKTFLLLLLAGLTLTGCTRTGPVQDPAQDPVQSVEPAHRGEPVPKDGFLDVQGGPVWYRVAGTGASTPLLLIHGGPGGRSCRLSVLAALGDQR